MAQNSQTPAVKPTTVLERIKAFFKLDDAGRVENFFKSEVKAMLLKIRAVEMNMKSNELKLEIELATIDSKIEDALQGIEDAYTGIKAEDVTNNDAMAKFSPRYWKAIEAAEALVADFQKEREEKVRAYEEELKANQALVSTWKTRIAKLS